MSSRKRRMRDRLGRRRDPIPSYLLPPIATRVVFHPSLRRASEFRQGR